MSSFQKVLIAVGLLCAAAQAVKVQTFSKNYSEPTVKHMWFHLSKTVDHYLMYILCNGTKEGNETNCWLKLKMVNGTEKRCNIKLPPLPGESRFLYLNYLESMLGGKKAVFDWTWLHETYEAYRSVTLVDMNNCRSDPTALTFKDRGTNVLVYDDSFHVIKRDIDMSNGSRSFCILRYDPEGQQVGDPVTFLFKPYDRISLMVADRYNSKSGFFLRTSKISAFRSLVDNLCHVSHEGNQTVLFTKFVNGSISLMSNEHGYLFFCEKTLGEKNNISCIQSDVRGQIKMNTTVTLEISDWILGIFSQRQGGIIIMYAECKEKFSWCTIAPVKVKMVDVEGKFTRNIELTGVKINPFSYSPSLQESNPRIDHLETDTEHCFYFAHMLTHGENTSYIYFNKCIDKLIKNEEKEKK